jgi:hypothetical protein
MHRLMVSLALATSAPALAQERPSRECSDDNGVDRCAAEQQRRVRELFGVPPIEELQKAGAEVRRAFFVDGYGRDQIALTFIRARGRDPMVTIHFLQPADGPKRPPIETPVPAATWKTALERGEHFDRRLVPVPIPIPAPRVPPVQPSADGSVSALDDPPTLRSCFDSWAVTVESVEAQARSPGQPKVRRMRQDSCGDSLAVDYAFELATLALPLFPFCAALGPEWHRNDVTRLTSCGLLQGDRLAAADELNKATELTYIVDADHARQVRHRFDYRAMLDWNGTRFGGDGGMAFQAWIDRTTGNPGADSSIERVIGEGSDRVRIEGWLRRREPVHGRGGEVGIEYRAPVTLLYLSEPNDLGLGMREARVGAFVARPAQDAARDGR